MKVLLLLILLKLVSALVCPDNIFECRDGHTCCRLATGEPGCCPFPRAVSCKDNLHCCPASYTCTEGYCRRELETAPMVPMYKAWVSKKFRKDLDVHQMTKERKMFPEMPKTLEHPRNIVTAMPELKSSEMHMNRIKSNREMINETPMKTFIMCSDNVSECPDSHTCCRLVTGEQGCCPLPRAVCCTDNIHCCPSSYTCSGGFCNRGLEVVPMVRKYKALMSKKFRKDLNVHQMTKERKMFPEMPKHLEHQRNIVTAMPELKPSEIHMNREMTIPMKDSELPLHTRAHEAVTMKISSDKTATIWSVTEEPKHHKTLMTCPRKFSTEFCVDKLCCASRDESYEYYGCCPHKNGQCCGRGCCRAGEKCVRGLCQSPVTNWLWFYRQRM